MRCRLRFQLPEGRLRQDMTIARLNLLGEVRRVKRIGKKGSKLEDSEGTIKVKNLADDDPDDRSVVYKVTKTGESLEHKEAKDIIRRTAVGVMEYLLEGFRNLH